MSTAFGILTDLDFVKPEVDYEEIAKLPEEHFTLVAFRYNDGEMIWKSALAQFLPDDLYVYPLDNTAQGIYTIGDIKQEIAAQTK